MLLHYPLSLLRQKCIGFLFLLVFIFFYIIFLKSDKKKIGKIHTTENVSNVHVLYRSYIPTFSSVNIKLWLPYLKSLLNWNLTLALIYGHCCKVWEVTKDLKKMYQLWSSRLWWFKRDQNFVWALKSFLRIIIRKMSISVLHHMLTTNNTTFQS